MSGSNTIYKVVSTVVFLAAFFVAFHYQHIQPIIDSVSQTGVIALRLMFLLTCMAIIALLIAKKPFLAYVAMGAGYLLGFTRTETVTLSFLALLLAGVCLHRLAFYMIERVETGR